MTQSTYKYLEWVTHDTIQQHRLAQEGTGWGGKWIDCTSYIPRTKPGELLGGLDLRDEQHPLLHLPDNNHNQATEKPESCCDSAVRSSQLIQDTAPVTFV